jgi:hypothetical protein
MYSMAASISMPAPEHFWEKAPRPRRWADKHLSEALSFNGPRLIQTLQQETLAWPAEKQPALQGLLNYLKDNCDSMGYKDRLKQGLPIGSGLIEGAGKNALRARLKANSARWRIRRAERIGALRCLDYSDQWNPYWDSKAAA